MMGAEGLDLVVVVLVVGLRLFVPLLIPRFPLPGIIASLVIDAVDKSIFQQFTDVNLDRYQTWDKALDIYYLAIAYLAVLRNWTNGFAARVARFLWYFRLVGVVLFELFESRLLLFVFPNVFEFFVIAVECVRLGWDPRRLSRSRILWTVAFIWIVIKLPQEWWIHIAKLDFTDAVQRQLFGVEPGTPWGETFANRPLVIVALVVLFVVLAVIAAALWRRRPPQDWPLHVDADRPLPAGSGIDAHGPRLAHPVVEKIALTSLVAIIFAQLLQLGASNLQVLSAAAVVVFVDLALAALAVRFAGRDVLGGAAPAVELAVMTVVSSVVISVFALLVADGRIDRPAALFFGFLLALLITLYDRYRAHRLAWIERVTP